MHVQRFTLIFTLLMLVLLALVPARTASAAPPVFGQGTYDNNHAPLEFQPCPGIVVWYHEVATYRETLYFDNEGNLKSVKDHFIGTDTFYNPENPGFELVGKFTATLEYDVETGNLTGRGIPIHITVPGYGTVLMWTGFWSIYPTVHNGGIDSTQNPKDMAAFCSLLAGQ